MTIKLNKIIHFRLSKLYPNCDFGNANIPYGNPAPVCLSLRGRAQTYFQWLRNITIPPPQKKIKVTFEPGQQIFDQKFCNEANWKAAHVFVLVFER
jgi:hypothetical protein